jgi:hypothetical protein
VSEPKKKRSKSPAAKVDRVIEEILAGADDPMLVNSLNERETEIYEHLLSELRMGIDPDLDKVIWRLHYLQMPVEIEQFFNDPYYLGEIHLPSDDNPGMWPEWKRTLTKTSTSTAKSTTWSSPGRWALARPP